MNAKRRWIVAWFERGFKSATNLCPEASRRAEVACPTCIP